MNKTNKSTPPLLPAPRRYRASKGRFSFSDPVPIVVARDPGLDPLDTLLDTATGLGNEIRSRFGIDSPAESHRTTVGLGRHILLSLVPEDARGPEAYTLRIDEQLISISGPTPAALRYGVETLKQILRCSPRRSVRGCRIEDSPCFPYRGVLIDISRGKVPRTETVLELMEWMVSVKLNTLMLYTEHVFRFRRHPKIGAGASPLDAASLRMLDREARRRHIELIPTLQSLGHMHHLLQIPEYRHLAESEKRWSVSPAVEQTYTLLEELYAEYLPNFDSRWFNANCDEPVDLGKGRSKARADRSGVGAVYRGHLERVRRLAATHGRRTMVWGDVVHEHPEEISRLDRRLMFLDWWYEEDHDFNRVRRFAMNDIDFMVCPGTSSWNSLFPRLHKAFANITGYARAGRRHGAQGVINTDWGDGGHVNLLGNSRMPLAWGAAESWSSKPVDIANFDRAFALHTYEDPTGEASRILRKMGNLHQLGFEHFNNSSIKTAFFDDVIDPSHLDRARQRAVEKTLRALGSLRERIDSNPELMSTRPEDAAELRWSVMASIVAMEKILAAKPFWAWRKKPGSLTSSERRRLAAALDAVARNQTRLRRQLRALWLKRNARSNFEIVSRLFSRSIRSLRRAASMLGA